MNYQDLQQRTKVFAVRVIKLVRFLQKDAIGRVIGNGQLLRSGTAVAANYRSACRSKSPKDFISKISTVVEEADETQFWLEILVETAIVEYELVKDLVKEAGELTAIMTASKNSAAKNQKLKNK
jgi:four helix bundle protein